MLAVYGQNMLWIKIKVTVTVLCCIVKEIYIDEITDIVAYLRHACSRDYATVGEAMFSPCRAELCRVVPRPTPPRLACC
jgi:hypothetical protein